MRIALVCRRYSPEIGGVETHVKELAENLAKKQHEVTVFTLTNKPIEDGSQETISGVNVRRFKPLKLSYSIEFPPSRMRDEIAGYSPQIVHSHSIHTFMPYFASNVKHGSKLVITPHYLGNTTSRFRKILFMFYKPFISRALLRAERVVPTTMTEKDMLTRDFNVEDEKIRIIPNGVGSDMSAITPVRDRLRILSVSRLDIKHKKIDKIIKAFKILLAKHGDLRLILVGDGPDKQQVSDLIRKLGLEDKVEIKSGLSREQILHEYASASVFVTASEMENFGIAVAEAVAARLEVVVPNASALSLLVRDGHALGIELPITPEKIASRISDCIGILKSGTLRDNPASYKVYTWENVATDIENLYLGIVSE